MFFLCSYQGFLSQKLMIHRTAEEERDPYFIPLYLFCRLTNIQAFICKFACEITTTYFQSQQPATKWDLPPYWVIWLIDNGVLISICLLDDFLLDFSLKQDELRNRLTWTRKDDHLELQEHRLTKCASHPKINARSIFGWQLCHCNSCVFIFFGLNTPWLEDCSK